MAANAYIGPVNFTYPLFWLNKGSVVSIGSDTECRDGNIVMLRGTPIATAPVKAILKYTWATLAQVNQLRTMAQLGGTYSADFEASGETYSVIIAKGGVADPENDAYEKETVHDHVEGTRQDIYNGEITVYIVPD
jgi:hypothetical protein